ncbi:MAG: acetyl-CoA carboxylase carboxyltransferase subunit alpha [Chloroflexota bacterium]|nr:acetyl-CoA carboxylase carboxyltransferase subunit alpha [Dehalococcoidia bacterium]MDW8254940.1 acetyl-CoA carboxylase carboxyltransferase subunit alpha [Chloroflexota bacterium]
MQRKSARPRTAKNAPLTAWDHVQLARHPARPYTLDYVKYCFRDFVELRGDRLFRDDRAIVGGLAKRGERTVVVIGHQKGRTAAENVERNFGMPQPEGFRKALRLMRLGEKFGVPVITFIDTPGASPDKEAEERGQAKAIADNLLAMASLRVPLIGVVIGEGNSGGALAIGLVDRLLMLEHAYFSVVSPEGCASILWRDPKYAPDAAEAMRITARDLLDLGLIDEVIPEPGNGAHADPAAAARAVGQALDRHLAELTARPIEALLEARYARYRAFGVVLDPASVAMGV